VGISATVMHISRPSLGCTFVLLTIPALVVLGLGYYSLILDHENMPYCHKAALMAVLDWFEVQKTDVLPNVQGRSVDSLAELRNDLGDQPWEVTYRYVPGLQKDDPGDLVLMYMVEPTRYIFHNNPQTIFSQKKWMIVPLDFTGQVGSAIGRWDGREVPLWGECSERVSLDEFQTRLKKTLDFLRTHERPNWQTVVAEHETFLESISENKN